MSCGVCAAGPRDRGHSRAVWQRGVIRLCGDQNLSYFFCVRICERSHDRRVQGAWVTVLVQYS